MTEEVRHISAPLDPDLVGGLKAGERVLLSGIILTGRDAAHKRMTDLIVSGRPLPFSINGQVIYFVGPTPPPPGRPIGAAGPTTAYRMDAYSPLLIEHGLKGMIGKGPRSAAVKDAMAKWGAVYFSAVGGIGALMSRCIKQAEVIAWEDLGTEAVRRLVVEDMPLIVAVDAHGEDLYAVGPTRFKR